MAWRNIYWQVFHPVAVSRNSLRLIGILYTCIINYNMNVVKFIGLMKANVLKCQQTFPMNKLNFIQISNSFFNTEANLAS